MQQMKILVYSMSFLLSFFITISLYLLNHLRPRNIERFTTSSSTTYQNVIPAYDDNFLLLTTYNKKNKIIQADKKWYDFDTSIDDSNTLAYFTYNPSMSFTTHNTYVESAKLNGIEMKGPIALKFANDESSYELTEFTILFMVKFNTNAIKGNHTMFELLGNTLSTGDTSNTSPTYQPNRVSLEFKKKSATEVDIHITIGNDEQKYETQNISILENGKPILLSLVFNKNVSKQVQFKIDSLPKIEYSLIKTDIITLGSSPIIINKGGELDCELFSMAYYKKALNDAQIKQFEDFNDYYIQGINTFLSQTDAVRLSLLEAKQYNQENKKKIDNLNKQLQKCISSKTSSVPATTSTYGSLDPDFLPRIHINQIPIPSKISRSR